MILNFETEAKIICQKNSEKISFSLIFEIHKSLKTQIYDNLFFRSLQMLNNW